MREVARRYLDAAEYAEKRAEAEKRQQEHSSLTVTKRARRSRWVIGVLAAVVVLLGILGVRFWSQAQRASGEAHIRNLAEQADEAGKANFPQRQSLLAVEAWRSTHAAHIAFSAVTEQALRSAVPSAPSLAVLHHENEVSHAIFSPDGRRIMTCSGGMARIWSADGGGEPVVLGGPETPIAHAEFSPDSHRIVSRDGPSRIAHVWNADGTGQPVA